MKLNWDQEFTKEIYRQVKTTLQYNLKVKMKPTYKNKRNRKKWKERHKIIEGFKVWSRKRHEGKLLFTCKES